MKSINRRNFLKSTLASTIALSTPFYFNCSSKRTDHPNIIYILADDLGYGDLSCLNENSKLHTINIDKLGRDGVIFTDAHSGSAVCTPTRYGILTGRYSWRSRLKSGVLWGYSRPLIPKERLTVASLLKRNGYTTGCIGKWHLGMDWHHTDDVVPLDSPNEKAKHIDFSQPIQNGPNALGFDYFFGISASLDMEPYFYIENDRITALPDRETENTGRKEFWRKGPIGADFQHIEVLPKLTEKAVEFVNQHAGQPFFLYFPLPAPHTPILPTDDFVGKSKTNSYGDFVLQVDWSVGQILDALKSNRLEENTLIIFTSDNGCAPHVDFAELERFGHNPNYVFRGHKADIYEGGHHIPFIARWPNKIKAGSKCDATICLTDFIATCAGIVKEKLPDNAGEDSYNLLPFLMNRFDKSHFREATVHHSVNGNFSIRQGKWKLVLCPGSGGWSSPRPNSEEAKNLPPIQLYDLENDIAETRNVYDQSPEVVEKLTRLLSRYIQNGRSTPGIPQKNDEPTDWPQLHWMNR